MEIRHLTPADDRQVISKIYEESWKYAYKGIIPQTYLDTIPEGNWTTNLDHPQWNTLICIQNDIIVGTTSFGKSRLQQFDKWGEIISIYLLPDYMGNGYGKALLESAITELKMLEYNHVFLWVLEENFTARHFYEKSGFSLTDDYLYNTIGGKSLREVRYIYCN